MQKCDENITFLFEEMEKKMSTTQLREKLNLELIKGGDEAEQCASDKEQLLAMRLEKRNEAFREKIKQTIDKISHGLYGTCEECGDTIAKKRLQARPTACLCITCQEHKEKNENLLISKRRDLKNVQQGVLRFSPI